ncbi:MAG: hypothetical protein NT069_10340 [Planctomycetota bacterium]|nr:hypothetical protein [Planctomycetota bacterium]
MFTTFRHNAAVFTCVRRHIAHVHWKTRHLAFAIAFALSTFVGIPNANGTEHQDPSERIRDLTRKTLIAAADNQLKAARYHLAEIERELLLPPQLPLWRRQRIESFTREMTFLLTDNAERNVQASAFSQNFEVARYYFGAAEDLRDAGNLVITQREIEDMARTTWGDESVQFGVAMLWRLRHELANAIQTEEMAKHFDKSIQLIAPGRSVFLGEYLLAHWLLGQLLVETGHSVQARNLCESLFSQLDSGQIVITDNEEAIPVLHRIHGVALAQVGEFAMAKAEFSECIRASYGSGRRAKWIETAVSAEQRIPNVPPSSVDKSYWRWRYRKEVAVSDGAVDTFATNSSQSDVDALSHAKLSSIHSLRARFSDIKRALADSDWAAAEKSAVDIGPLVSEVANSISAGDDPSWLCVDIRRLAESRRPFVNNECRRAVALTWKAFATSASNVFENPDQIATLRTELQTQLGHGSASLWYFERAVAKSLRERGRLRKAFEQLSSARSVLVKAGKLQSPLGVVQSTEEMVVAALAGDSLLDTKQAVLAWEISLPRSINYLPIRANQAMAMGMNCVVGKDFAGAEAFGNHADFLCRHEHLQEYNGPDFTTPLAQAIRATAYAHYGEPERAEKEFASMMLALEGGEGIRAPELRWFALKLYADFLEKEGKTARAKKIRQLSEAELPDREGR